MDNSLNSSDLRIPIKMACYENVQYLERARMDFYVTAEDPLSIWIGRSVWNERVDFRERDNPLVHFFKENHRELVWHITEWKLRSVHSLRLGIWGLMECRISFNFPKMLRQALWWKDAFSREHDLYIVDRIYLRTKKCRNFFQTPAGRMWCGRFS